MTRHSVDFHPEAVAEAQAAFEWYKIRSDLAASAFMAEIDEAVEHIEESPGQWPPYAYAAHTKQLLPFVF